MNAHHVVASTNAHVCVRACLQCGPQQYVLRKKPAGKILASAHAVEREHSVQAALASTNLPVPRMLCLCTDTSVLGTPFYVMEHVKV